MKFKDLSIGQEFEFESTSRYLGMEHGPWRKVSARKYVYADGRKDYSLRVVSVNVEVVPIG